MFKGIEGARGWLSLAVLFSHIIAFTSFHRLPKAKLIIEPGHWAVLIFIMISGFVITNLITRKQEGYGIYIARRALRIYPAYLVALVLGFLVLPRDFTLPEFGDILGNQVQHVRDRAASYAGAPGTHVLLHLSMLHGIVPNNILPEAQYMFVPPAWSLSLEWQFYLLAPAILVAIRRWPLPMAVFVAIVFLLAKRGMFGHYYNPSFILNAGWWFLIGILSYLYIDRLPRIEGAALWTLLALLLPLAFFNKELVAVLGWVALIAYIRSDANWRLLDGPLAAYLGARSYGIYILHMPILIACCWVAYSALGLTSYTAACVTGVLTTAATFILAEIVYRTVERPAINFGKRLGREPVPATQGW
jgi:peptidoglycan/LPS O-acetylase OafA/YrhL